MDFAILAEHKMNINENEKIDKYLDLARELKKNMMTVIQRVIGALRIVPKGLEKLKFKERIEIIKTTALKIS